MDHSKITLIGLLTVGFLGMVLLPRILMSPATPEPVQKEQTFDEIFEVTILKDVPPQTTIKTTKRFKRLQAFGGDKTTPYTIDYFWYAPKKPWPESIKFPLVIHLQDVGKMAFSAEYMTQPAFKNQFPAFHFVPILPPNTIWADYKETPAFEMLPYISQYIDYLIIKYPIDTKRIYLVGCGIGGHGAFGAIEERPSFYAASIIVNSSWKSMPSPKLTGTPIFIMMGEKNEKHSKVSAAQLIKDIRQSGGKAEYKEFVSMPHNCSFPTFYKASTWDWMFSNKSK